MAYVTGMLIVLGLMVLIFLGPEWGVAIYRNYQRSRGRGFPAEGGR